jgi:hypothetical protein
MKRALLLPAALLVSCGGSTANESTEGLVYGTVQSDRVRNVCDASADDREANEYDTTGDNIADVRKVFRRFGAGGTTRLVLICREADLNGDGTKDIVRYYTDEGRPLREEADRNFDGRMDTITFFDSGSVAREEVDTDFDGKVDLKVFFSAGAAVRAERDTAGRSTADAWRADRWEYYTEGRVVRVGADVDGDGVVDRWDRDEALTARTSIIQRGDEDAPVTDGGVPDGAAPDAAPAAR